MSILKHIVAGFISLIAIGGVLCMGLTGWMACVGIKEKDKDFSLITIVMFLFVTGATTVAILFVIKLLGGM